MANNDNVTFEPGFVMQAYQALGTKHGDQFMKDLRSRGIQHGTPEYENLKAQYQIKAMVGQQEERVKSAAKAENKGGPKATGFISFLTKDSGATASQLPPDLLRVIAETEYGLDPESATAITDYVGMSQITKDRESDPRYLRPEQAEALGGNKPRLPERDRFAPGVEVYREGPGGAQTRLTAADLAKERERAVTAGSYKQRTLSGLGAYLEQLGTPRDEIERTVSDPNVQRFIDLKEKEGWAGEDILEYLSLNDMASRPKSTMADRPAAESAESGGRKARYANLPQPFGI